MWQRLNLAFDFLPNRLNTACRGCLSKRHHVLQYDTIPSVAIESSSSSLQHNIINKRSDCKLMKWRWWRAHTDGAVMAHWWYNDGIWQWHCSGGVVMAQWWCSDGAVMIVVAVMVYCTDGQCDGEDVRWSYGVGMSTRDSFLPPGTLHMQRACAARRISD